MQTRVENALGAQQFAIDESQDFCANISGGRFVAKLPGMQLGPRQLRVVVEHPLEVSGAIVRVEWC